MRPKPFIKAAGIVTAFGAIVLAAMFSSSRRVRAIDDDDESSESKIRQGFEIAPVPLNLDGKNRARPGGIRQLHCKGISGDTRRQLLPCTLSRAI